MEDNYGLSDAQVTELVEEKLKARTLVLDGWEKNLAIKNQEADKKINEYREEKDLFDTVKLKFEEEKASNQKVYEEEMAKLTEAQTEANERHAALDLKIVEQNKREDCLDIREKVVSEKESEFSARETKIESDKIEIEGKRVELKNIEAENNKTKVSLEVREQEMAVMLDKAIALDNSNKEKEAERIVHDESMIRFSAEFEKNKAVFLAEQTKISNDNQIKARLLDEQIKSVQSLKLELDKQQKEMTELKDQTLKNG